jgi:thiol-disulfide isomerase/thioredoxin
MNKTLGIILVIIILLGGVYLAFSHQKEKVMVKEDTSIQKVIDQKSMQESGANNTLKKESESMVSSGTYEAYAPEKITLASSDHSVVLFFRASWCPSCRSLDADIKANLSKIPNNVTILDVNYDSYSALKQKYAVTYQHTLVQVDKDGNMIKKWSGSSTLSSLLSEIK